LTDSSRSFASVGRGRNSRAPARIDRRITALSRSRLAGRTATPGFFWRIVWISWMPASGSESRTTITMSGETSATRSSVPAYWLQTSASQISLTPPISCCNA